MSETSEQIPCKGAQTQGWFAWADEMPPGPPALHMVGEVEVPNPGVVALLVPDDRPGIPETLALALRLVQRPGAWPEVVTWTSVRYDRHDFQGGQNEAVVYCGDDVAAHVPIQIVH